MPPPASRDQRGVVRVAQGEADAADGGAFSVPLGRLLTTSIDTSRRSLRALLRAFAAGADPNQGADPNAEPDSPPVVITATGATRALHVPTGSPVGAVYREDVRAALFSFTAGGVSITPDQAREAGVTYAVQADPDVSIDPASGVISVVNRGSGGSRTRTVVASSSAGAALAYVVIYEPFPPLAPAPGDALVPAPDGTGAYVLLLDDGNGDLQPQFTFDPASLAAKTIDLGQAITHPGGGTYEFAIGSDPVGAAALSAGTDDLTDDLTVTPAYRDAVYTVTILVTDPAEPKAPPMQVQIRFQEPPAPTPTLSSVAPRVPFPNPNEDPDPNVTVAAVTASGWVDVAPDMALTMLFLPPAAADGPQAQLEVAPGSVLELVVDAEGETTLLAPLRFVEPLTVQVVVRPTLYATGEYLVLDAVIEYPRAPPPAVTEPSTAAFLPDDFAGHADRTLSLLPPPAWVDAGSVPGSLRYVLVPGSLATSAVPVIGDTLVLGTDAEGVMAGGITLLNGGRNRSVTHAFRARITDVDVPGRFDAYYEELQVSIVVQEPPARDTLRPGELLAPPEALLSWGADGSAILLYVTVDEATGESHVRFETYDADGQLVATQTMLTAPAENPVAGLAIDAATGSLVARYAGADGGAETLVDAAPLGTLDTGAVTYRLSADAGTVGLFEHEMMRHEQAVNEGATVPLLDEDGNPVLDDNGNPVMTTITTTQPIEGANGALLAPVLDANGDPVLDTNGDPVMAPVDPTDPATPMPLGGTGEVTDPQQITVLVDGQEVVLQEQLPNGQYRIYLRPFFGLSNTDPASFGLTDLSGDGTAVFEPATDSVLVTPAFGSPTPLDMIVTATNLANQEPLEAFIRFENPLGIAVTVPAGTHDATSLSALFTPELLANADVPKVLVVDEGSTLLSTDPATPALALDASWQGELAVYVRGSVLGAPGTGGGIADPGDGQAGGPAIRVDAAVDPAATLKIHAFPGGRIAGGAGGDGRDGVDATTPAAPGEDGDPAVPGVPGDAGAQADEADPSYVAPGEGGDPGAAIELLNGGTIVWVEEEAARAPYAGHDAAHDLRFVPLGEPYEVFAPHEKAAYAPHLAQELEPLPEGATPPEWGTAPGTYLTVTASDFDYPEGSALQQAEHLCLPVDNIVGVARPGGARPTADDIDEYRLEVLVDGVSVANYEAVSDCHWLACDPRNDYAAVRAPDGTVRLHGHVPTQALDTYRADTYLLGWSLAGGLGATRTPNRVRPRTRWQGGAWADLGLPLPTQMGDTANPLDARLIRLGADAALLAVLRADRSLVVWDVHADPAAPANLLELPGPFQFLARSAAEIGAAVSQDGRTLTAFSIPGETDWREYRQVGVLGSVMDRGGTLPTLVDAVCSSASADPCIHLLDDQGSVWGVDNAVMAVVGPLWDAQDVVTVWDTGSSTVERASVRAQQLVQGPHTVHLVLDDYSLVSFAKDGHAAEPGIGAFIHPDYTDAGGRKWLTATDVARCWAGGAANPMLLIQRTDLGFEPLVGAHPRADGATVHDTVAALAGAGSGIDDIHVADGAIYVVGAQEGTWHRVGTAAGLLRAGLGQTTPHNVLLEDESGHQSHIRLVADPGDAVYPGLLKLAFTPHRTGAELLVAVRAQHTPTDPVGTGRLGLRDSYGAQDITHPKWQADGGEFLFTNVEGEADFAATPLALLLRAFPDADSDPAVTFALTPVDADGAEVTTGEEWTSRLVMDPDAQRATYTASFLALQTVRFRLDLLLPRALLNGSENAWGLADGAVRVASATIAIDEIPASFTATTHSGTFTHVQGRKYLEIVSSTLWEWDPRGFQGTPVLAIDLAASHSDFAGSFSWRGETVYRSSVTAGGETLRIANLYRGSPDYRAAGTLTVSITGARAGDGVPVTDTRVLTIEEPFCSLAPSFGASYNLSQSTTAPVSGWVSLGVNSVTSDYVRYAELDAMQTNLTLDAVWIRFEIEEPSGWGVTWDVNYPDLTAYEGETLAERELSPGGAMVVDQFWRGRVKRYWSSTPIFDTGATYLIPRFLGLPLGAGNTQLYSYSTTSGGGLPRRQIVPVSGPDGWFRLPVKTAIEKLGSLYNTTANSELQYFFKYSPVFPWDGPRGWSIWSPNNDPPRPDEALGTARLWCYFWPWGGSPQTIDHLDTIQYSGTPTNGFAAKKSSILLPSIGGTTSPPSAATDESQGVMELYQLRSHGHLCFYAENPDRSTDWSNQGTGSWYNANKYINAADVAEGYTWSQIQEWYPHHPWKDGHPDFRAWTERTPLRTFTRTYGASGTWTGKILIPSQIQNRYGEYALSPPVHLPRLGSSPSPRTDRKLSFSPNTRPQGIRESASRISRSRPLPLAF